MPSSTFTVHTSLSFDAQQKKFVENVSLQIDGATGTITDVYHRSLSDDACLVLGKDDIDLRSKVVLPGLVDSHTHIFLHSYRERSGTEQMRDESAVERVVRATHAARAALLAGFTTYRDLGTEALGNADANLRDCINRGITPGPRMFVATEALASSGSYELRMENRLGGQLVVPRACDAADGVDGVRAAVRRRVGDGADLIKLYADYRRKVMRFPPMGPRPVRFPPPENKKNPAVPLYSQQEMDAVVEEAERAEMVVAAHAGETRAALMAVRAGVRTVEHIFEDTDGIAEKLFEEMRERGTIWVPTLAAAELMVDADIFAAQKVMVKRAFDVGVRLATGGDTGTFDHGLNARELEILVEAGLPVEEVLAAATVGGWEACGGDRCGFRFGWFEKGNRADVVALDDDPRVNKRALRNVSFVMKDGETWKRDAKAVTDMVIHVPCWPEEGRESSPSRRSSDEWTELSGAQPPMGYVVPPVVCKSVKEYERA